MEVKELIELNFFKILVKINQGELKGRLDIISF